MKVSILLFALIAAASAQAMVVCDLAGPYIGSPILSFDNPTALKILDRESKIELVKDIYTGRFYAIKDAYCISQLVRQAAGLDVQISSVSLALSSSNNCISNGDREYDSVAVQVNGSNSVKHVSAISFCSIDSKAKK